LIAAFSAAFHYADAITAAAAADSHMLRRHAAHSDAYAAFPAFQLSPLLSFSPSSFSALKG
jgi:hypothetical protein